MRASVRVGEIVPQRRMAWDVVSARLGSETTVISLVQAGFAAPNDDVDITTTGWGIFLQSLRAYLETGTGVPFPETRRC